MWLYFNKKGQLIKSLEHGEMARAGTTAFSIFAVFEDIDSSLGNVIATIKLFKPDLRRTSYPILVMPAKPQEFVLDNASGETASNVAPFQNGITYQGFYFDFSDFNDSQDTEVLLDTDGLWNAVITLIANQKSLNVKGVASFNVGYGEVDQDGTEIDIDVVLSQIMGELATKLNIDRGIYTYDATTDTLDLTKFEEGQLFIEKNEHKAYILEDGELVEFPFGGDIVLDTEPDVASTNGITNSAITTYVNDKSANTLEASWTKAELGLASNDDINNLFN